MDVTDRVNPASLPRRLLALLATVFAVLVLASACGRERTTSAGAPRASSPSATASTQTPVVTAVRRFAPFRADGRPAVRVARTATGSCFAASAAAPTARAYRCFAGNTILDPCFAPAGAAARSLLCVSDPWSAAVRLRVPRLPAATAPGAGRAWAFELARGLHCVAATGTVPSVAGVDLPYRCTDPRTAPGARATPIWAALPHHATRAGTILARYARPGARAVSAAPVRILWRV